MDKELLEATNAVPRITLRDGTRIPQLGFGTLNVPPARTPTPENMAITADIVRKAIETGYRLIDTAQMYGNEKGVGEGVATSGVPRDQIYVTSKLGNGNHKPDDVRRSFDETFENLGLEYLDLFLIHWPLPTLYEGDYVSTWKAMAELVDGGRVRSVGVSNFQQDHLERITSETGVTPVINQIELHPGFNNAATKAASEQHGIAVEAWSPLGQGKILADPTLGRIAAAHRKTIAQVVLRWHIQHGNIVFPKSMNSQRMAENTNIFDFELTAEDVTAIDALDKGEAGRVGPNPDTFAWIPAGTSARPRS
jgi:2,5-diketo-D-gluconate reductase A